ncbi:MAG: hypothetical protein AAF360_15215 [Pseudomonadota bacterium]
MAITSRYEPHARVSFPLTDKAVTKVAALGEPAKVMNGGVVGWRAEGCAFATGGG